METRNQEIWSKRKEGATSAELSVEYGISRSQINRICNAMAKEEEAEDEKRKRAEWEAKTECQRCSKKGVCKFFMEKEFDLPKIFTVICSEYKMDTVAYSLHMGLGFIE